MRKKFADVVKKYLTTNENAVVLLGDISVGLFVDQDEKLHDQVYNVGILEQSMISFAAGLSAAGNMTFVHTISSFIVERAFEQIKLDLSYNKNNVVLVSANGPYDYSKLGPTHHCSSDIPILSQIPNLNLYLPGRVEDVEILLEEACVSSQPTYLRLSSHSSSLSDAELNALRIRPFNDITIFVGETLSYYQQNSEEFEDQKIIYVKVMGESIENQLLGAESITVYEPYSYPIFAHSINFQKSLEAFCYPKSIETGIFTKPYFVKNIINR
tara:strand:- start:5753 stop:6562 length:810 start_codon:yes stop_codon:yes gene_type:complete